MLLYRYAIKNTITGAILRKSMLEPLTFYTRGDAAQYIRAHRLNPDCYAIIKTWEVTDD
jgi:hypothetical protein